MSSEDAKMKVLVVDDDPINLRILVNTLKGTYDILTAKDGHEALVRIAADRPDLVLLDVMMPGLDGMQVCQRVRADPELADTPIIFVTGLSSPEGEGRGLELGAVDYITKPVDLKLAKLRIRNHLELRRQGKLILEQNALLSRQKAELEASLARVKRLEGFITICRYCSKIRADEAWQHLEAYLHAHSDARFSDGLCPECLANVDELST
jgi:putative two-component system response regulator